MRILGIACLLLTLTLTGCSSLLFYPEPGQPFTPDRAKIEFRDVTLTTADGLKLHGWWLPAAKGVEVKGTVLHLHGNGGNLSYHLGGSWWLPCGGSFRGQRCARCSQVRMSSSSPAWMPSNP